MFLAITLLVVTACGGAPLAESPGKLPEAPKLGTDAETYVLDAKSMSVEADVHAMASHTLKFSGLHGTLAITPTDIHASNVDVVIDTTTASATLAVVADVAKSEFLETGSFPTAHFSSRSITSKKGSDVILTGELELHGKKRAIRVPASFAVDRCTIDFSTSFSLNRRDYQIQTTGSLDGVVGEEVELRISAHVPRKSRPPSCPRLD